MSDVIQELRRKEESIRELKDQESRRQGREDTLRSQLKTEFGLDSVEAANKQLEANAQEIADREKLLQDLNVELENIIHLATSPSTGGQNASR